MAPTYTWEDCLKCLEASTTVHADETEFSEDESLPSSPTTRVRYDLATSSPFYLKQMTGCLEDWTEDPCLLLKRETWDLLLENWLSQQGKTNDLQNASDLHTTFLASSDQMDVLVFFSQNNISPAVISTFLERRVEAIAGDVSRETSESIDEICRDVDMDTDQTIEASYNCQESSDFMISDDTTEPETNSVDMDVTNITDLTTLVIPESSSIPDLGEASRVELTNSQDIEVHESNDNISAPPRKKKRGKDYFGKKNPSTVQKKSPVIRSPRESSRDLVNFEANERRARRVLGDNDNNQREHEIYSRVSPLRGSVQRAHLPNGPPSAPPLTVEMVEAVEKFIGGDTGLHPNRGSLTRREVALFFRNRNWLEDNNVDEYLRLILKRSLDSVAAGTDMPNVFVYPSCFYPLLVCGNGGAQDFTTVAVFRCDLAFFPIIKDKNHWVLIVANFLRMELTCYDSYESENNISCLLHISEYLQSCAVELGVTDLIGFTWNFMGDNSDIPHQKNGNDCGVFMLQFAEYISRGLGAESFDFVQRHIPYFRRRMAYEVLTGKFLTEPQIQN